MVWVEAGNWSALQSKLTAGPWHVLHVIAHGGVSDRGGVLALENEATGVAAQVSAQRFARLLHACRPVPRLVVLNACSSGEAAADDLLSSTAAALVHSGISAAVAMQFAVTDPAALAFSRGFYQALAQSIAVDEAVRLGRIAIDGTSEQTLEWVTPVIYLRTDDTRLFDLTSTGPPVPPAGAGGDLQRGRQVRPLRAGARGLTQGAVRRGGRPARQPDHPRPRRTATPPNCATGCARSRSSGRRTRGHGRPRTPVTSRPHVAATAASSTSTPPTGTRRSRHDEAERLLTIASLKDELKVHANEEDWDAVLAVSAELDRLDPDEADPDGLATRARELTAPQEVELQPARAGSRGQSRAAGPARGAAARARHGGAPTPPAPPAPPPTPRRTPPVPTARPGPQPTPGARGSGSPRSVRPSCWCWPRSAGSCCVPTAAMGPAPRTTGPRTRRPGR